MTKTETEPKWISRLRSAMQGKGLNPRSLSLSAGLNPTAVRDMLEGRVKFPRYDTVESLSAALNLTPAQLMSGEAPMQTAQGPSKTTKSTAAQATPDESKEPLQKGATSLSTDEEDLNLLTEIITRLQETAEEYRHALDPKEFAVMVTTIYRQIRPEANGKTSSSHESLAPKIKDLITYDRLRRKVS